HDRQAQPGAGQAARLRRAVEAIEDAPEVGVRDAGPVVAHADLPRAHRDLDGASGRRPLASVVEEVRDRALEARLDDAHEARLRVEPQAHRAVALLEALDDGGDDAVEPDVL